MRAGIAEPVGRRAHLRRGTRRDPLGPRVDVGRRHHRHPGRLGDLAQGSRLRGRSMSYTVVVYRYTNRDLALASRPRTAEARPGGQVSPRGQDFRRDAPTLLCYGAISVYAFWLYAYGPALTLLRTELHFSYTVLGVYSALWSVGAVVTGASFARLARR